MPFGKPRTDVRKALEEAMASGVRISIKCFVIYREFEETGYVKSMAKDRVIFGRYKEDVHGTPRMLADIKSVSFWEQPGEPGSLNPDPEPVDNPPPKSGAPGKREQVPTPGANTKVAAG